MHTIPPWLLDLEDDELIFMKRFILASGSLKEIAGQYNVTYPTVRLRLDRLIQKIRMKEEGEGDPLIAMIHRLASEKQIPSETAKLLISEYRKQANL